jgi:hypothetical protein
VFSVMVGFIGVMIVLISSRQTLLTLRADTFRARGNRLIRRTRHPVMFWMNVGGIAVLGIIGLALIGNPFWWPSCVCLPSQLDKAAFQNLSMSNALFPTNNKQTDSVCSTALAVLATRRVAGGFTH